MAVVDTSGRFLARRRGSRYPRRLVGVPTKASGNNLQKSNFLLDYRHVRQARLLRTARSKKEGDAEKFKEVSEAYSVLSDDKRRAEYDSYGRVFGGGGQGGPGGFGGFQGGAGGVDFFQFQDAFSRGGFDMGGSFFGILV